jgi:hypothetical protein
VKPSTIWMTYPIFSLCNSLMETVLKRNNKFVNYSVLNNHMTDIVASARLKMMSATQNTSTLKDSVFQTDNHPKHNEIASKCYQKALQMSNPGSQAQHCTQHGPSIRRLRFGSSNFFRQPYLTQPKSIAI